MKKILVSIFCVFLLAACSRVNPILNVDNAPIGYDLQSTQVKAAIEQAAKDRGWIVTEVQSGELKADLLVRSHTARINITYDEKFYSIHYLSSTNLKAGNGKIHRNYNRWVNNLNVDIQRNLATIAAAQ
ncbi:hypothetical protein VIRA109638_09335 [Vibrio rarus]